MKKFVMAGIALLLAACSNMTSSLKKAEIATAGNVFVAQKAEISLPPDKGALSVFGSIKRPVDSADTGNLIVNVDGQREDIRPTSTLEDLEPRFVFDPEKGKGRRDSYRKDFVLTSGTHRLVVALPEEGIAVEKEVVIGNQQHHALVVEPTYRSTHRRPYSVTDFMRGIENLRIYLNGSRL